MTQKFIDRDGLKVLWNQVNLKDYPNNETLMAVIDAIDETKADKNELVQADWNQTDENKLDYIKNRTHYHDKKYGFLFAFDTDEGNRPPSNHNGTCIMVENSGYKFVEGETYTIITVDKYGVEISGDVICTKVDGKLRLKTTLINSQNETTYNYNFYQNESESDTTIYGELDTWINSNGQRSMIKLYGYIGEELKQLDEKYIPDTIARKNHDDFVITLIDNGDETYSVDKTFDEILQAHFLDKKNLVLNNSCLSESFLVPSSLPYLGSFGGGFQFGIFVDENATDPSGNAMPLFIGLVITPGGVVIFYKNLFDCEIGILKTTNKSVIGAINEVNDKLPTPNTTDSNKVLTVNSDGTTIWSDLPQPDWNQNDEAASDYIKNRPFYTTDPVKTVLLEETSVEITENGGYNVIPTNVEIVAGDIYFVTWNGTEYECVAYMFNGQMTAIGNLGLVGAGEDTGEPFLIATQDGVVVLMICASEAGTHTVSISANITTDIKMDEKYLPINVRNNSGENSIILNDLINNIASGNYSHAEGGSTTASGNYSHAEGSDTNASGWYCHAEGYRTTASGDYSHAEGSWTTASSNSHAEGYRTTASGDFSHAEGCSTTSSGDYSHAEGNSTTASGWFSHAEGNSTTASGNYSHAEGDSTIATTRYQHVQGKYNKYEEIDKFIISNYTTTIDIPTEEFLSGDSYTFDPETGYITITNPITTTEPVVGKYIILDTTKNGNTNIVYKITSITDTKLNLKIYYTSINDILGKYAHIVGNGTAKNKRSNAHTLDWEGNAWYAGDVYVGGTSQDDGKKLATEEYVFEVIQGTRNAGKYAYNDTYTIFNNDQVCTGHGISTFGFSILIELPKSVADIKPDVETSGWDEFNFNATITLGDGTQYSMNTLESTYLDKMQVKALSDTRLLFIFDGESSIPNLVTGMPVYATFHSLTMTIQASVG